MADGLAAGELFVAPSQNLMLADRDGIAMQMIGAMPAPRSRPTRRKGRMPTPGWLAAEPLAGHVSLCRQPALREPDHAAFWAIPTTRRSTRPSRDHVSFDWGDTERIQRWLR